MEIISSRDNEKRPQAFQQGDREWLKEETGRLRGTSTKRKKLPTASSAELLDVRAQDLPAGVFRAKFDAKPPFPLDAGSRVEWSSESQLSWDRNRFSNDRMAHGRKK